MGTKLKLACELNEHRTIGIDLVAMSVNDLICTGAKPLLFLDYLATSKLDLDIHTDVVRGISEGCMQASCALIGGETAEMPGMYQVGDYDLAGFCVGDVQKENVIDGSLVTDGMSIYALKSSGFHSNGYSLVRALLKDEEIELKRKCLTPTKIYVKEVLDICRENSIAAMAHITGGGLNNIKRVNPNFGYDLTHLPPMPDFMDSIIARANLNFSEMYTTFNMGLGFVLICEELTNPPADLIKIGTVSNEFTGVRVLGHNLE